MGFADRDYARPKGGRSTLSGGGGFGGFLSQLPFFTRWLLIINVVVWFLNMAIIHWMGKPTWSLTWWGAFSIRKAFFEFQIWRVLFCSFLHANATHLLMNMVALFFFGPIIERYLGSARFLLFYILSGLASVFALTAISPVLVSITPDGTAVGASGCIFGLLAAAAVIAPNATVLVFFVLPMKMKHFALAVLGIGAYFVLTEAFSGRAMNNSGGHLGHLGGAAMGWLLIKRPLVLDRILGLLMSQSGPKTKSKQSDPDLDKKIDRILEKVKAEGIQSLTKKEKKILASGGNKNRPTN